MQMTSAEAECNLRVAVLGHVDHGKSTTIGRLLHDTESLPDGKIEELRQMSERRGIPLEWWFVLDAFKPNAIKPSPSTRPVFGSGTGGTL